MQGAVSNRAPMYQLTEGVSYFGVFGRRDLPVSMRHPTP